MSDIETIRLVRDAKEFPDSHEALVDSETIGTFLDAGWKRADPLDHDGDGKKGGAKPGRKAKASQDEEANDPPLTRREIEADLTAMGEDFDPTADLADLRKQRDEARAVLEG